MVRDYSTHRIVPVLTLSNGVWAGTVPGDLDPTVIEYVDVGGIRCCTFLDIGDDQIWVWDTIRCERASIFELFRSVSKLTFLQRRPSTHSELAWQFTAFAFPVSSGNLLQAMVEQEYCQMEDSQDPSHQRMSVTPVRYQFGCGSRVKETYATPSEIGTFKQVLNTSVSIHCSNIDLSFTHIVHSAVIAYRDDIAAVRSITSRSSGIGDSAIGHRERLAAQGRSGTCNLSVIGSDEQAQTHSRQRKPLQPSLDRGKSM